MTPMRYPIVCPTLPEVGELEADLRAILASGRVTVGPQTAALEEEVCARTGVRHAVAVSSGTSGLMLLIRALGLPAGGEVITPSFTFAATAQALLWNGLRPVFGDSEPKSFTLDAAAAEALVTPRTAALYPVCIFGVPGDLAAYQRLADKYGLALIYDSAQGLGSSYRGQALGGFGRGEVFSMSPTKVVTALEGGLITTNDEELAGRLRGMRDYGKAPDGEDMAYLGLSARMGEVNALVARWSLARMERWIAHRAAVTARYRERLGGLPGAGFQHIPEEVVSCRNYLVLLLDPAAAPISRDELYQRLKDEGIQTKRYFYPALHQQTLFRELAPACGGLPVAEWLSACSLALPMYSHLPLAAVDEICERILAHAGG